MEGFEFIITPGGWVRLQEDIPFRSFSVLTSETRKTHTLAYFKYRDYHFLREPQSPTDVVGDALFWESCIRFDEKESSVKYLYLAGIPLISLGSATTDPSFLQETWRRKLMESFDIIPDLIYKGMACVELAYRGEKAPVFGYKIRYYDFKGNKELAEEISDQLLIALLRLPDLKNTYASSPNFVDSVGLEPTASSM